MKISEKHGYLAGKKIKAIRNFDTKNYRALSRVGILSDGRGMDERAHRLISKMMAAMDAIEPTITAGTIATPIQFLQNWLPGLVYIITAARKIDELVGISTTGAWEDEEIVQQVMELTGYSQPYGDYTNVPFGSWNPDYETRTNIRFEQGMKVGLLEEARAARVRIDTASAKRESAALALEIVRNKVGFFGYNAGNNRTYGFLNDPGLPSYVTVGNGASGSPLWSTKTFLEIQKDILGAISSLRNQTDDVVDPEAVNITMGIATAAVDYLAKTSDFGISVREWMREAYPRIRVVSAPELNAANGGANVFYLYADQVMDSSTDSGRVMEQNIPTKFMVLGVQQLAKGYLEDYSNATSGIMVKRPYAVVRRSGI